MADDGGIARLKARFNAIPRAAIQAVQPAVLRQANEIAATARQLAPVESGDLRRSIRVTGGGQQTPPYSQPGGSSHVPSNAAAVTVGNGDVRYAHLVEYGHGNGFHGSSVPAKPFFWPAVRLHNRKAKKAIKAAVGRAVRKAWKEGKV